MVRDPLPVGTHGVLKLTKLRPGVWRARASYRDWRGVRRDVTAQGPTKAAAELKLKSKLAALPASGASLSGTTTLKVALDRQPAQPTTCNYAEYSAPAHRAHQATGPARPST